MKIVVHDYAGHPFQFDLSRKLSVCKEDVYHIYTDSSGGPKAGFDTSNYPNLNVITIVQEDVKKSNFLKRFFQEYRYGKKLVQECLKINPNVIISANTPIPAQYLIWKYSFKKNINFIFWLQDIISIAAGSILRKKIGLFGKLVASVMQYFEKKILKNSSHIISIAEDFTSILNKWKVSSENITVIPNWAPIDEMPVLSKNNQFSKKHKITNSFNIIYSGTMGFKHNPQLILELADNLSDYNINIIVISEGEGMNYLRAKMSEKIRDNLILLPFQPFSLLPSVLGSADVLLTLLEPEAGVFSVPSKVWSGYCAGRASLLFVPANNLAAKITDRIHAGLNANSSKELIDCALTLYNDKDLCDQMGENARQYAESNFHIENISKKFLKILFN